MYKRVEKAIMTLKQGAIHTYQTQSRLMSEDISYLQGPLDYLSVRLNTAVGTYCPIDAKEATRQRRLGLIKHFLEQPEDLSEEQRRQLKEEAGDLLLIYGLTKALLPVVNDALKPCQKTLPEDQQTQAEYLRVVRKMVTSFLQQLVDKFPQAEPGSPEQVPQAPRAPTPSAAAAAAEKSPPPPRTPITQTGQRSWLGLLAQQNGGQPRPLTPLDASLPAREAPRSAEGHQPGERPVQRGRSHTL